MERQEVKIERVALTFDNDEKFADALDAISEVSNKPGQTIIEVEELGLPGEQAAVVLRSVLPRLERLFAQKGIQYGTASVQSMSDLSPEARAAVKRHGKRVG